MTSYEISEINYNVNTYNNFNPNIENDTYIEIITPNTNKLCFILSKDSPFKAHKW